MLASFELISAMQLTSLIQVYNFIQLSHGISKFCNVIILKTKHLQGLLLSESIHLIYYIYILIYYIYILFYILYLHTFTITINLHAKKHKAFLSKLLFKLYIYYCLFFNPSFSLFNIKTFIQQTSYIHSSCSTCQYFPTETISPLGAWRVFVWRVALSKEVITISIIYKNRIMKFLRCSYFFFSVY